MTDESVFNSFIPVRSLYSLLCRDAARLVFAIGNIVRRISGNYPLMRIYTPYLFNRGFLVPNKRNRKLAYVDLQSAGAG